MSHCRFYVLLTLRQKQSTPGLLWSAIMIITWCSLRNSQWIFIQPISSLCLAHVVTVKPCLSLGQRGGTPAGQQDLRRTGTDGVKVSSVERAQRGTCSRNRESGLAQSLQRRRHNSRELACRGAALRTRRGKDRRGLQVEPQRRGAASGCRGIWCSSGNGLFSRLEYQSHFGTVTGLAAGVHKQGAEWHGRERKLHWELFLHLRNCSVLQLGK